MHWCVTVNYLIVACNYKFIQIPPSSHTFHYSRLVLAFLADQAMEIFLYYYRSLILYKENLPIPQRIAAIDDSRYSMLWISLQKKRNKIIS